MTTTLLADHCDRDTDRRAPEPQPPAVLADDIPLLPVRYREPTYVSDIAAIRRLFDEYADWITRHVGVSLWHAQPDALVDRSSPHEQFADPGCLVLAVVEIDVVGMIGVRSLDGSTAELARCYVSPTARSCGIGRRLVESALDAARRSGHSRVELETVPASMPEAFDLYRSIGFEVVENGVVEGFDVEYVRMALEVGEVAS